jgi:hypothetical protein
VTIFSRAAYEIIKAVCGPGTLDAADQGETIRVGLEGSQISLLLELGSEEQGTLGVAHSWADEACWSVYEAMRPVAGEGHTARWWRACEATAGGALEIDSVVNTALCGAVEFAKAA